MSVLKLRKKDLSGFLEALSNDHELYVPVKTDLVRFERYSGQDVYLNENSYFHIKEFFFKKREVLFNFDGNRITVPVKEKKQRIFFGLRRCDLNAVLHQDRIFIGEANDIYYKAERENTILIGYHCNEAPSEFCFCGSLELEDFHDLMFFDRGDEFLVEVGSEKGKEFISRFAGFFDKTGMEISDEEKKIPDTDSLMKKDLSAYYDHPDWKKGVELCLSCTACTALCPTCYCFEIHDETSIRNLKKGQRVRNWSSCQLKEFTKVAGDYVFREKREERFKHRIYHQLQYFRERYGVNLCTGCGRCISGCPTRIDFVKIINEME